MPKLQVTLTDGTESTHDLNQSEITVGRVEDNGLPIVDGSVSSHHAVLILSGEDYILKDIGSTNGTRLNGKDLEPDTEHKLKGGDKIRFGKTEAVYVSDAPVTDVMDMPEEAPAPVVASSPAQPPANFSNASPFTKKSKKKDPAAVGILVLGIVALVAFCGAMAVIAGIKSPL